MIGHAGDRLVQQLEDSEALEPARDRELLVTIVMLMLVQRMLALVLDAIVLSWCADLLLPYIPAVIARRTWAILQTKLRRSLHQTRSLYLARGIDREPSYQQ